MGEEKLRNGTKVDCDFWVYNYQERKCSLYYMKEGARMRNAFFDVCVESAGPKRPNIDQCRVTRQLPGEQTCKGWAYASCKYNGDRHRLTEFESEAKCQESCQISEECDYWIYTKGINQQNCELKTNTKINGRDSCAELIGLKEPALAECIISKNTEGGGLEDTRLETIGPAPSTAAPTTATTNTNTAPTPTKATTSTPTNTTTDLCDPTDPFPVPNPCKNGGVCWQGNTGEIWKYM